MKKIVILTAAILLIGCDKKPAPDAAVPPAPIAAVPTQSPAPPQTALQTTPQSVRNPVPTSPSDYPQQAYAPEASYPAEEPQPVVSVYEDFPQEQPAPILVDWAPPPMLVDAPPPSSDDDAVWTGGYWVWEGGWVWAHGRWSQPPHRDYHWHNPYYEHVNDGVVFVNGFWGAPNVGFVPPSHDHIARGPVSAGIAAGRRPEGPLGVFVPPPPGSHYGLIVPAPVGTPPAVVMSVPPMVRVGMHVVSNSSNKFGANPGSVTVVAPANATAAGRALNISAPAVPHLAAAQRPLVNVRAPEPASQSASQPIPAYQPGRAPFVLPPPQPVQHGTAPNAQQGQHTVTAPPTPVSPPRPQVLEAPRVTAAPPVPNQAPHQHQAPQPEQAQVRQPEQRAPQAPREENNPAPSPQMHMPQPVVQKVTPPQNVEQRVAPAPRAEPVQQQQPHPAQAPKPEQKGAAPQEKDKHEHQ